MSNQLADYLHRLGAAVLAVLDVLAAERRLGDPAPSVPSLLAAEAALDRANRRLPDYAQVRAWITAAEPFTPINGMSTANGRLRRPEIFGKYAARIDALYQNP